MKRPTHRLALPLALIAFLLGGGIFLITGSPAEAQCLSESECDALREQIKEFRSDARARKQQIRALRSQIRALPADSAERAALIEQARALGRQAREQHREARPVVRSFRQGCRRC
ncbi:MAG: hypothetical protein OES47_10170 [Acidobacteriota bacterium]|nr:hypothetical protein [Acidobacteriota bacterium]